MMKHSLMQMNHGFLSIKKSNILSSGVLYLASIFKMQFHKRTNSVVVSSAVATVTSSSSSLGGEESDQLIAVSSIFLRPFVTIWKYKTSTLGFTLLGESFIKHTLIDKYHNHLPFLTNDWITVQNEKQCYSLQNLCLCYDTSRGYRLAYVSENNDDIFHKELFSVGLLSPSSSRIGGLRNDIHEPCSIFLTHDSVSYLDSLPVSTIFASPMTCKLTKQTFH